MYRVIVSDIDGTLVDERQEISEQNLKAVQRFQREGGIFTLATGRVEQSVERLIQQLNIEYPVILYNGGKIIDYKMNQVIYERNIPNFLACLFVEEAIVRQLEICIYTNEGIIVLEETDVIRTYAAKDRVPVRQFSNLLHLKTLIVYKILIIDEKSNFDEYTNYFERVDLSEVTIVQSENTYFEILPANVSKGRALKVLIDYLNVPLQSVVAIGDHFNDLEMLKVAGLGVAVDNAIAPLKECADAICPSNLDHGVATVIYKYCL